MPNYVTTLCTITGPEPLVALWLATHVRPTTTVFSGHAMNDDQLDFNTVIAMPPCVDAATGGREAMAGFYALTGLVGQLKPWGAADLIHPSHGKTKTGLSATREEFAKWLRDNRPDVLASGEAVLKCFRETGHLSRSDWAQASWGTSSNSYEYRERERSPGRLVFKFVTSWTFPAEVFEALAKRYPVLNFITSTINESDKQSVLLGQSTDRKFVTAISACSDWFYKEVYGYDRD